MNVFSYLIWFFPIIFLYLTLHETGHYLCGRYIFGIQKAFIKIVLNRNPAHVALKDEFGVWLEPGKQMDAYILTFNQRAKKNKDDSFWFILAGFIFQTIVFLLLSFAIAFFLSRSLALYMMILSLILTSAYSLFDFIMLKTRSVLYGDISSAFLISPFKTSLILLIIIIAYILFFVIA